MDATSQFSGNSETVSGYRFQPADLRIAERKPGISAFMRIRNGADFLELTIRSHIAFYDEIVAVHNQCTDDTADILQRLQREYGKDRLRVIHYTDRVFPQGTTGHAETPADSPNSVVNYSNFALAATRHTVVTKLDDDHLAMSSAVRNITDAIRSDSIDMNAFHAFSGLNLIRERNGELAIAAHDPVSGGGDIGYFRVTPKTYFYHDRRFERFHSGVPRRFAGYLYWHMKFLKAGQGFNNYELADNPTSRYARRKLRLDNRMTVGMTLNDTVKSRHPGFVRRLGALASEKQRLILHRDEAVRSTFPDDRLADAVLRTVEPEFHSKFLSLFN